MAVGGRGDRLGAPPHPHVTARAAHGYQTLPQPLSRELPRRKSDREEHGIGDHHNKHTQHNPKQPRLPGPGTPPGGTAAPSTIRDCSTPLGPPLSLNKPALTRRPEPSQGSRAGQQPMRLRAANSHSCPSPPPRRQATKRDDTTSFQTRPPRPQLCIQPLSRVSRGPGPAGPRSSPQQAAPPATLHKLPKGEEDVRGGCWVDQTKGRALSTCSRWASGRNESQASRSQTQNHNARIARLSPTTQPG